jgi:mannose-6-phosphate isomerase-like protein (cupin superfamily)
MQPHDPTNTYVHLDVGPGATTIPVDDSFWATINEQTDLHTGRLVTGFGMVDDWTTWEMHPNGDELIAVTEGSVRVHVEHDGDAHDTLVAAPVFVLMPAGAWHTMDAVESARLLVITWGEGTQHRPR